MGASGLGVWSLPSTKRIAPWEFCQAECEQTQSSTCRIKGNINDKGDRIYHVPGSDSYDRTGISTSRGERWFC